MHTVTVRDLVPEQPATSAQQVARLNVIAHELAEREARVSLESELLPPRGAIDEKWLDFSRLDEELVFEEFAMCLEYLGMRGLVEVHPDSDSLFRILDKPVKSN